MSRAESDEFEQEVRRLARELFPSAGGYSPVNFEGRERDGVFDDGETIHIVEATRDTRKAKAEKDLNKSKELKNTLSKQYPDYNFKIWFITEKDPTADQAAVAQEYRKKARCPVLAMSIRSFGQRLVDAPQYLECRRNYSFGSIRNLDPKAPQKPVPEEQFVPIDMLEQGSESTINPDALVKAIGDSGGEYLLLGDFGAGKSMTMRYIFNGLKASHARGKSSIFPIYMNLRDHIGQDEPSSALYDHGTRIGFSSPERLVRAWRAGFVHLLLDGFDEVSSSRFRSDSGGLKKVRYQAMALVRRFVEQHPSHSAAIFVSGRENYFSSPSERDTALGLQSRNFKTLTLNEFTLEQIHVYLKKLGLDGNSIPDWLPSRPLLVGYLAIKNILQEEGSNLSQLTRAEGWDYLLDQISMREAGQIEDLGGEPTSVRIYVDRLATRARSTTSGRGPVPVKNLIEIFRQVSPSTADEAAQQLLVRMAGLTASPTSPAVVASAPDQEDAREFVDDDMVDAARAGDVIRFINYSYDDDLNELFSDPECVVTMGDLGVEVCAFKLKDATSGMLSSALKVAATKLNSPALAFDIFSVTQYLGIDIVDPDGGNESIVISDGFFNELTLFGSTNKSLLTFNECMINVLNLGNDSTSQNGPKFKKCQIEIVTGISSIKEIPHIEISTSEIDVFKHDTETNRDLLALPVSVGVKVLLTALRKLFVQSGKGRKESAFPRGLSDAERPYVNDVLTLIEKHDFAHPYKIGGPVVWMPNRSKSKEAIKILQAPQQVGVKILEDAKIL